MAPYVWVNMLSELQGLEWVRVHWMSAGLAGGEAGALPSLFPLPPLLIRLPPDL